MSEARQFQHIGQRTIRPDGFDKVPAGPITAPTLVAGHGVGKDPS